MEGRVRCACIRVGCLGIWRMCFQKAHFSFMYMPACLHTPELHGTPRSTVLLMALLLCAAFSHTQHTHTHQHPRDTTHIPFRRSRVYFLGIE